MQQGKGLILHRCVVLNFFFVSATLTCRNIKLWLIQYVSHMHKIILNVDVQLSDGARGLSFGLSLHLGHCILCASSGYSDWRGCTGLSQHGLLTDKTHTMFHVLVQLIKLTGLFYDPVKLRSNLFHFCTNIRPAHEMAVHIAYAHIHTSNEHAQLSSQTRRLTSGLNLYLLAFLRVDEQQMLRRECAYAHSRLNICCSLQQNVPNMHG